MKLLYIHNRYRWVGGEDGMFDEYVAASKKLGHRVVTYTRGGRSESFMRVAGLFIFPLTLIYSFRSYKEIHDVIQTERPDAAVVFNLFPFITISALIALRRNHVPVILRIPNYRLFPALNARGLIPRRDSGIFRLQDAVYSFIAWIYHWFDFPHLVTEMLVPSDYMKKRLIGTGGYPSKHITVIENCSPTELFWSRNKSSGRGPFSVVYVGRLSPEKGVDILLRALVYVPRISAVIIGDGPERSVLQRLTKKLKLSHVYFVGKTEGAQKMRLMEYADCTVVPSVWPEPFGRTAVEAMAMGKCVVASRSGALPSILTDGIDGVLFRPSDPKDLGTHLRWLARHPQVVSRIGKSARNTAKTRFTRSVFQNKLRQFYEVISAYKV